MSPQHGRSKEGAVGEAAHNASEQMSPLGGTARNAKGASMIRPLLSAAGEAELATLATARSLYAFDFDGTLAPIVASPDRARITAPMSRLLVELARQAPVAVISGRSRSDLRMRLPSDLLHIVGNHGNESEAEFADELEQRRLVATWRRQLETLLSGAASREILIEDKGLSLSLHYRLAADRDQARSAASKAIEQLTPAPLVIGGKMVINLLPQTARTKLEALQELATREQARRVLFVGDDDTDELVFECAPPEWITVRVAHWNGSRARYFLHQQSNVTVLLDLLLRNLRLQARQAVKG
jgi:trehalose 6-phosphate phosphatase